jgi:hypothetical protein
LVKSPAAVMVYSPLAFVADVWPPTVTAAASTGSPVFRLVTIPETVTHSIGGAPVCVGGVAVCIGGSSGGSSSKIHPVVMAKSAKQTKKAVIINLFIIAFSSLFYADSIVLIVLITITTLLYISIKINQVILNNLF